MTTTAKEATQDARWSESARKIRPPFELDPSLRFYSPQANVDAMSHPEVAAFHEYIKDRWEPPSTPAGSHRVALLIPCTKLKPYSTSREHRAINGALLAAGWKPDGVSTAPDALVDYLEEGEDPELLHDGPLRKGDVYLDRFVLSEPMAMVPYPHIYYWRGRRSPAAAYDDPGLFEARGTSVSPGAGGLHRGPFGERPVEVGTWGTSGVRRDPQLSRRRHKAGSHPTVTRLLRHRRLGVSRFDASQLYGGHGVSAGRGSCDVAERARRTGPTGRGPGEGTRSGDRDAEPGPTRGSTRPARCKAPGGRSQGNSGGGPSGLRPRRWERHAARTSGEPRPSGGLAR